MWIPKGAAPIWVPVLIRGNTALAGNGLIVSCIILKNGQTYCENIALFITQEWKMFGGFSACLNGGAHGRGLLGTFEP